MKQSRLMIVFGSVLVVLGMYLLIGMRTRQNLVVISNNGTPTTTLAQTTVTTVVNTATVVPVATVTPAVIAPVVSKQYTTAPSMTIDVKKTYTATIKTPRGDIVIKLRPDLAPETVNSFVFLARDGFYNGLTWHRVIADFMAQGGDPTGTGMGGPGYTVKGEFTDKVSFDKPGYVAMARPGNDVNGNGSQFFITTAPATYLDNEYTIFGEVVSGQDIVNGIPVRDPESATTPGETIESITISDQNTTTSVPAIAQSSLNATYAIQWSQKNYYQHIFALGDINGDEFADIGLFDDTGDVKIYFGSINGLSTNANQSASFLAGQGSIVPICDVNNDSFDDVIITEDKGNGWFVPGARDGLQFGQRQNMVSGGWSPRGQITNKCFGDVTGDGIADAVVLTDTELQVLSGGSGFLSEVAVRSPLCSAALFLQGTCNIGVAGDVNGDTINDIAVMRTVDSERIIELYKGNPQQIFDGSPLSVTRGVAEYANAEFASSFASIGDVNRDGFDDIGVTQYWNGVMLYLGSPNGYTSTPDWMVTGFDAGLVASAGDINDDGYDDLYVGSPWQATARIFLGDGKILAPEPVWVEKDDGHFGWPGGDAGDIDGNGKNDIFVGAHYTNGTAKVFLFR